jgi:hypothetical protein
MERAGTLAGIRRSTFARRQFMSPDARLMCGLSLILVPTIVYGWLTVLEWSVRRTGAEESDVDASCILPCRSCPRGRPDSACLVFANRIGLCCASQFDDLAGACRRHRSIAVGVWRILCRCARAGAALAALCRSRACRGNNVGIRCWPDLGQIVSAESYFFAVGSKTYLKWH